MPKSIHWRFSGSASLLPFDPSLRKATTMMKMLVIGLNQVCQELGLIDLAPHSVSTFLGSLHGEIEPTLNYLKELAQSERPRPFLFQNSLHHSTTGFASQRFQWIGPAYSLCCIRECQFEILRAGLLQAQKDQPILLIHVESFPEELSKISEFKPFDSCEILFLDKEAVAILKKSSLPKDFEEAHRLIRMASESCELR